MRKPRFEFISVSDAVTDDSKSRKVIRSHVMVDYRRQERDRKLRFNSLGPQQVSSETRVADPFHSLPIQVTAAICDLLNICESIVVPIPSSGTGSLHLCRVGDERFRIDG